MKIKTLTIFILALLLVPGFLCASAWEVWELGGEFGLVVGAGGKEGRILSPGIAATITKTDVNPMMEFGLAYYFGSELAENYKESDVEDYGLGQNKIPEVIADAGKEIRRRLSVVPVTLNFIYTVYDNFYIGGGVGLYNVWYRIEPTDDHRVNPDGKPGDWYSHTPTTNFGFQQIVGMEIFPVSENWKWFVGARSFLTSGSAAGRILGITIGGKVRYTW